MQSELNIKIGNTYENKKLDGHCVVTNIYYCLANMKCRVSFDWTMEGDKGESTMNIETFMELHSI